MESCRKGKESRCHYFQNCFCSVSLAAVLHPGGDTHISALYRGTFFLGLGQKLGQGTSVCTWPSSCRYGREPWPGSSWRCKDMEVGDESTQERGSLGPKGIRKWEGARL